jgi:hypothetical protein
MAAVEDHDLITTTPASRLNHGALPVPKAVGPAVSLRRPRAGRRACLATECAPGGEWESSGSLKIEMPAKDTPCYRFTPLPPTAWALLPVYERLA